MIRKLIPVRCLFLLLLLQVVSCAVARAQKLSVVLDPRKTEIKWTLVDTLHTVHGTFKMKRGTVVYDTTTGTAEGAIVIDAASGQSGEGIRDGRMKKEFLDVQTYPEIIFKPLHAEGPLDLTGGKPVKVSGTFMLHGVEHPFSMNLTLHGDGKNLTATTHFDVPYVAWGIKDPSIPFVRVHKDVTIDVAATGTVAVGTAAAAGAVQK